MRENESCTQYAAEPSTTCVFMRRSPRLSSGPVRVVMTHRINIKDTRGDKSKKPMSLPDLSTLGLDIGVSRGKKRAQQETILGGLKSTIKKTTKSKLPVQHGSLIDYIKILIRILQSEDTPYVDPDKEDGDLTYAEARSRTLEQLKNLKGDLEDRTIGTPNYPTTNQWNNWIAAHMFGRVPNYGLEHITSIKMHADEIWHTRYQTFTPLD